jgi:hypothetical protein
MVRLRILQQMSGLAMANDSNHRDNNLEATLAFVNVSAQRLEHVPCTHLYKFGRTQSSPAKQPHSSDAA